MVAFYLPVICIIYCYNREIGAMERMASASSVIPTLNSCECIINKAVLLFIRIHLADKSLSPSIASWVERKGGRVRREWNAMGFIGIHLCPSRHWPIPAATYYEDDAIDRRSTSSHFLFRLTSSCLFILGAHTAFDKSGPPTLNAFCLANHRTQWQLITWSNNSIQMERGRQPLKQAHSYCCFLIVTF